jgi:hypothetical protein
MMLFSNKMNLYMKLLSDVMLVSVNLQTLLFDTEHVYSMYGNRETE